MNGSSPGNEIQLPRLTLVIGGARSGKSGLAERLVSASRRTRVYLATAEAGDGEMASRIARHREDRGAGWVTVEAPRDLSVLNHVGADQVVLLDCVTMWLTNQILAGADLEVETRNLLAALANCLAPIVAVSNEVGWSIVPENALARAFRDHQGQVNQRLAGQAGLVIGVMAGLPMVLKGRLPEGFA